MTQPNQNDISRALGRVEGDIAAVKQGFDRLERVMSEGFSDVGKRLSQLESKESGRSALERAAVWLSGVIGAGMALIVEHFWK